MALCRTTRYLPLLAAAAGALCFFGSERDARADFLTAGAQVGVAARSSDSPGLKPGFAVGVHAEYKIIPMLSIGPYYTQYDLHLKSDAIESPMGFRAVGGRVRFTLVMPEMNLRPYIFAGLGRTGVTVPTSVGITPATGSEVPTNFSERSGWFLEVPVGIGIGYKLLGLVLVHADFAYRPGFSFHGSAYTGDQPYDKPKAGYSGLFGVSLDI